MLSVYVLGMLVAILAGLFLKNTLFKGDPIPFVIELPAYRIPDAHSVFYHMLEKAKDFLHKAFTIIFLASIVIWFLQSFNFHLNFVEDSSTSILAYLGTSVSSLFVPLGFNDWRVSTALVTGITAKESVVSTLSVLTHASSPEALSTMLQTIFTPLSAYSYLVFTILYMPCIAAFAATKRELGSLKQALLTATFQTSVAYFVAMAIFQIGSLFL